MCSWGKLISTFLSWVLPLNEPGNPPLFSSMLEDSMENSSSHEEKNLWQPLQKNYLDWEVHFLKDFFIYKFDLNNCRFLVGHS